MSNTIRDLGPTLLFSHFADLIEIPRGSKQEEKAREYILGWATKHGFATREDSAGNVAVVVPATPGHENAPGVIIQGHLDIVWEKTPQSTHNFETDPIPAFIEGDLIRTKGTTLGADNGIGVAAGLAAALDPECIHGPLELLCTVDEETGMGGAFGIDPNLVNGRTMLNLDSEDEGTLFVGCAGGGDSTITLPITRSPKPENSRVFKVSVSGLRGGHSGLDIAKGRGNAVRLLARAIMSMDPVNPPMISCISGGTKRNAIPRDSHACVIVPEAQASLFALAVADFDALVRTELGSADPGVKVEATACDCNEAQIDQSGQILRLLMALPHGPVLMSTAIEGMVDTSSNLALVAIEGDSCRVLANSRSSTASSMEAVRWSIRAIGELAGGKCELTGAYPGWRPNIHSQILKVCRDIYKTDTGTDAKVTGIHAGLECGVLGEKFPEMDMISFGPDIRGAHSPEENLSISSSRRFYDYLRHVLVELIG